MKKICAYCDETAITELDGDNLCKRHANEWMQGEGRAVAEYSDCGAEGWDGALVVCYGNKCH